MKTKIITSLVILFFLSSCVSTMKYTWTKENYEGKKFNNILVLAIAKNLEARTVFENTVVKALADDGINATNSLELFPPVVSVDKLSEEAIESKIRAGKYDAVIVSTLVDVNSQDVYEYDDYYYPVPYRYRRHIYYGYGYSYNPGYYRQERTYVLESRLFDTAEPTMGEAIIWSGQSEITDPSSYESGSKEYAYSMVKTLLQSEVLKK
ncbi:MAG: hypothetical protein ABFS16_12200 [Bacteroidota bacterium]